MTHTAQQEEKQKLLARIRRIRGQLDAVGRGPRGDGPPSERHAYPLGQLKAFYTRTFPREPSFVLA